MNELPMSGSFGSIPQVPTERLLPGSPSPRTLTRRTLSFLGASRSPTALGTLSDVSDRYAPEVLRPFADGRTRRGPPQSGPPPRPRGAPRTVVVTTRGGATP